MHPSAVSCLVSLLILLAVPARAARAAEKSPTPAPLAQEEARRLVHERFEDELARRGEAERATVARTMLAEAHRAKDDPTRFVLLDESRTVAAQAGDEVVFRIDGKKSTFFNPNGRGKADMKCRLIVTLASDKSCGVRNLSVIAAQ